VPKIFLSLSQDSEEGMDEASGPLDLPLTDAGGSDCLINIKKSAVETIK